MWIICVPEPCAFANYRPLNAFSPPPHIDVKICPFPCAEWIGAVQGVLLYCARSANSFGSNTLLRLRRGCQGRWSGRQHPYGSITEALRKHGEPIQGVANYPHRKLATELTSAAAPFILNNNLKRRYFYNPSRSGWRAGGKRRGAFGDLFRARGQSPKVG